MKLKHLLFFLSFFAASARAQISGLYNTGTLYDTFENPSQKAFIPDSSRRIAFNFFIPNGGMSLSANGPATTTIENMLQQGKVDATSLDPGSNERSRMFASQNAYLLMLRLFLTHTYNREIGFSWQLKSEGNMNVSNGTFSIFHNYKLFDPDQPNENIFNNNGEGLSYHQFSLTYRENYNRRLAFGAKLSYLSGIAYSKLQIGESSISINPATNTYHVSADGYFKSSFLFNKAKELSMKPGFRNPGLAATLSANLRTRNGWYLLGNLKDIGMIKWTKDSYFYNFNSQATINNASSPGATKRLRDEIQKKFLKEPDTSSIYSLINGKAEILINRSFNNYHPNLILSKNIFNKGGNIALVNTYKVNNFAFSLLTNYDLQKVLMFGGQFLYRSPNFDFFLGSDQLLNTYKFAGGMMDHDKDMGNKGMGASVYMGLGLKFGRIMERYQTSNTIYGVKNIEHKGLLKKIFGKKDREEEDTENEKVKQKKKEESQE